MASSDDAEGDVRRNRRRVRVRKATAAPKTTTSSSLDYVAALNDNADPLTGAEAPEVETVSQDGSTDPLTAAADLVHSQKTPTTTVKDSLDDSELTKVAKNGDFGDQLPTRTEYTTLNDVSPPPPTNDASKKSRRKRRGKNTAATKTASTNSTVDDVAAPEAETARRDCSIDPPTAAAVHAGRQVTPTTTIKDSDIADNGELGVQRSTETDDTVLNDGSHTPLDDSPSHLPHDPSKKSRGKRRVKNKEHSAALVTHHLLNGHEGAGDWFTAVRSADIATIRRLEESRAVDVNSADEHGKTALHMAAEIKNAEIIDVLASFRNIDVNRTNSNGETALYVSSRVVHTATASHLLAAGADANAARPDDGSTPLHCACQDGDGSALVGLLLDGGARPDAGRRSARSDVTGITPLHDAADVGDAQSVAMLLDRDETLADAVTDRGCTALHVAARHGYRDIVDQLLSHSAYVAQPGADSRGLGVQPLHLSAENGSVDTVRALLAAGADPNVTREFCGKAGVTALHLAVMRGRTEVANVLLEAGAAVCAADEDGATALHVAARGGAVDVARLLLQHGAVVDATTCQPRVRRHGGRNSDGLTVGRAFTQTPLHFAIRYRHLDVAAMLIEAGSDVNAAEQMLVDETALRHKTSQSQEEMAVTSTSTFKSGLVGTTSTTATQLANGYTGLHWAVENDDLDAVQLLLDAGADVNRAATFDAHAGVTPLHLAAQDGRADVASLLLRHGAMRDPRKSTRNRENITPLHQAVYNSYPATVAVLLAAGCDPNVQADNGYAALHYAAQKGSVEMTRAILGTSGCDVALRASTREQQDITALHLAVQSGSVDVVVALAAAGAPIDAGKRMGGGVSGVTALHQAVYQERGEIVAALLELGADPVRSMDGWYTPLHVAAEKGCLAIARQLVEATSGGGGHPALDARASLGEHADLTPLHVAAQHGHREIIKVFVDAGADTAAVRVFGDRGAITALHLASENGFADAVVTILELTTVDGHRASLIDAQDSLGFTALHLAVQYRFADVVRALLVVGVDASVRTNDGLTAWDIARQLNDASILQVLGPQPPMSALGTQQPIRTLSDNKQKSNKLRSLLCGMNKRR